MENTVQNIRDVLSSELEHLAQKKDELNVQMALGSKEAKDEWDKIEKKFYAFEQKVKSESKALEHAFDDSLEAMKHEKEAAKDRFDDLKANAEKELSNLASTLKNDFTTLREKFKS